MEIFAKVAPNHVPEVLRVINLQASNATIEQWIQPGTDEVLILVLGLNFMNHGATERAIKRCVENHAQNSDIELTACTAAA